MYRPCSGTAMWFMINPKREAMAERILVLDDEPQILWLVGRFLRKLNYDVTEVQRGQDALDLLQKESFALILSDLRMPDIDGLTLLEQVNKQFPDTIFIMMTAYATIDLTISALRKGVYDFLTKPLDLNQLTLTVQKALRHRALTVQNRQLLQSLQANNAKLEELNREEQRKSEQLRQVNAIARQITGILDVDRLIKTVIEQVSETFGFAQMHFGIVDNGQLTFRGPFDDNPGVPVQQSIYWALTHEGHEPFVRAWAAPTQIQEMEPPIEVDLVFPLRAGDQVLGFWVANWRPDDEQREENLPYLEALAAQTAIVLENAQLYTLAKRADELTFINRVGEASKQSLNLKETIQSVLLCVQGWGAHLVEICLLDEKNQVQQAFSLIEGNFSQDEQPILGEEFVHRVGTSPLLLREQEHVQQICQVQDMCSDLATVLGVPLFFGTQSIGVLIVGEREPYAYSLEDGHLLQIAGRQVAMAIENARLFQEVEANRRAITESRNTLLAVFDSILDGIYIVDRTLQILAINRTQSERAHRTFGQLVNQPAALAFPGSVHTLECITKTFESGQPASYIEQQPAGDDSADIGRLTEWHIHTYPVATEGERVEHVVVVVRDVTEQRRLEATLLQSEKMASVGQLAAGIAHEINNPLTVISANMEILREEIPSDNPLHESVELIGRASERATHVVQSLLRFSRPEQFEFAPTDVNESVQDTLSLIGQQFRKANIQIEADLAADLPQVWGSRSHLRTIWLNLLLNARDAIQEAQREGKVHILTTLQDHAVIVKIADNGVGMPPGVLKRLYDPFFTTKAPDKGTGLGLFNCYRAVEQHQGEIHVESQEGIGTTFEIRLPVQSHPTFV